MRIGSRVSRHDVVGIVEATIAGIAFGTMAIFAKHAYDDGADSLPLLAVRFSIAGLLLFAYRRIVGTPRADRRAAVRLMLLGVFGYAFEAALFFIALEHAPAAAVSLVFYSFPMWVTIAGLWLGLERFRGSLLFALGLGTTGVLLIFSLPEGGLKGPLFAAGAALAVAVYMILAQILGRGVDSHSAAMYTVAGAALALAVPSLVSGQELPAAALPEAVALGAVTATAFVGLYAAVARIGSPRASVAMMVEPVTTVLLAAVFLDEELSLRIAVATALIVAALPILASRDGSGLDSAAQADAHPTTGRNE